MKKRIFIYELTGFGVMIILLWANEIFDLPHNLFGGQPTPINWLESYIESGFALILCALVILFTLRFLKRIKYLEGFLPVCSFCKKIRVGENWIPIEKYIKEHSEADFTHSLCPTCKREHYQQQFQNSGKDAGEE